MVGNLCILQCLAFFLRIRTKGIPIRVYTDLVFGLMLKLLSKPPARHIQLVLLLTHPWHWDVIIFLPIPGPYCDRMPCSTSKSIVPNNHGKGGYMWHLRRSRQVTRKCLDWKGFLTTAIFNSSFETIRTKGMKDQLCAIFMASEVVFLVAWRTFTVSGR